MFSRPVSRVIVGNVVTQQKCFKSFSGIVEIEHGNLSQSRQIANDFIFFLGNIDVCEIFELKQLDEFECIEPIGFHSITRGSGNF